MSKHQKNKKGFILALVVVLIPIFVILMSVILQSIINETRFSLREINTKKAFYLAETGMNVAYYEFSGQSFNRSTHESDGVSVTTGFNKLQSSVANVSQSSTDGWYEWKWQPGCGYSNYMDGNAPETYRYRVYFPNSNSWVIESTGIYGDQQKRLQCIGSTEFAFNYAIFDDQTLSEFTRGRDQTITGKVHANGDLHFRPDGTNLDINSTSVTAAGDMIRYEDAWGRADSGGTVDIANKSGTYTRMKGKSDGCSGEGNAFDSKNSKWTSLTEGALALWGGVVKDESLGGAHINAPAVQSFDPGGYYDQSAGAHITPTTTGPGLSQKTFYNKAEGHNETVIEIDLATYTLPANGLLYATTPIRLVNGGTLKQPITIVSNSNIYTKGDFNKDFGNKSAYDKGTKTKVPAALMTKGRLYHLSSSWNDAAHNDAGDAQTNGNDPSLYTGDANNVVEINACLVDGTPTVDERNWVKNWQGTNNPYWVDGNKDGLPDNQNPWANCDDFLETFGSTRTVKKKGSIVHLQNGSMCNFNNTDYGPGKNAWILNRYYEPPIRNYSYDTDLSTPAGQPPFAPFVSRKLYWKQIL